MTVPAMRAGGWPMTPVVTAMSVPSGLKAAMASRNRNVPPLPHRSR